MGARGRPGWSRFPPAGARGGPRAAPARSRQRLLSGAGQPRQMRPRAPPLRARPRRRFRDEAPPFGIPLAGPFKSARSQDLPVGSFIALSLDPPTIHSPSSFCIYAFRAPFLSPFSSSNSSLIVPPPFIHLSNRLSLKEYAFLVCISWVPCWKALRWLDGETLLPVFYACLLFFSSTSV